MDRLGAVLRRDRLIILVALGVITLLAWWYLIGMARQMGAMGSMPMPRPNPWAFDLVLPRFIMWVVMMIAMMTPTATPMILTFAGVRRNRLRRQQPYVPVAVFVSGYLAIWAMFAAIATVAQLALHDAALLSPMMASSSSLFAGIVLLLAAAFQFTPMKQACLTRCRGPLDFIMAHWREGWGGAFVMGLEHGLFCTGCCWALMGLLFVLGVMNLVWMAVLTALIALEKFTLHGSHVRRGSGALLAIWGLWMLSHPWLARQFPGF